MGRLMTVIEAARAADESKAKHGKISRALASLSWAPWAKRFSLALP
jgi:hypothetical protein